MKKIFYIKENCNWVNLTGKQFYAFVKKPENRHRRFIKIIDAFDEYTEYIIEADEDRYKKWRADYDNDRKLQETEEELGIIIIPFDEMITDNYYKGNQVCSAEDEMFKRLLPQMEHLALKDALLKLEPKDFDLIYLRYNKKLSQTEVAEMIGKSQSAVSRQEKNILYYLRKLLAE